MGANMMKPHFSFNPFPGRNSCGLAAVLLAFVATLTFADARADEPRKVDAPSQAPSPESLAVDASLFSTHNYDWFDGQRQRQVPAKLYLPAAKAALGSMPLVVFSHGIGGSREGYSYLGRYLAAHGYGSLHVQHVGSDRQLWFGNPLALPSRLSDAAQASEAIHRVQDLRFSLDQVMAGHFGAVFDQRRIVAAGHSYGANTTMLISGALVEQQGQKVSLRDPRISAAIIISAPPFYGMGSPNDILSGIDIPSLHITATQDLIQIPGYESGLQDRIDVFKAMSSQRAVPKVLAVFKEGSHSIFTDRSRTGGLAANPKVKIATRQLALAFLKGIPARNYQSIDAWSLLNAELVARFERLAP
jgi:predicted dienelactone hydrolase